MSSTRKQALIKMNMSSIASSLMLFAIMGVLLSVLIVVVVDFGHAEPASDQAGSSALLDQSESQANPLWKRQYFISPHVGRGIWPSASDQVGPAESQVSPIFYLLNPQSQSPRHQIGLRSSSRMGYIPQARIGRRAAPMGLMPMPRIGRSDPSLASASGNLDQNSAEIALASVNDNSLVLLSQVEAAATSTRGQGERIEMPVHRATAFVPRLGKRQDYNLETSNFGDSITSMQDGVAPSDMRILLSMLGSLQPANTNNNLMSRAIGGSFPRNLYLEENSPSELDLYRRLYAMNRPAPRREPASYMINPQLVETIIGESGSSSVKRVPFTPRIG